MLMRKWQMNGMVDMSVELGGLGLSNPVFTASGTCGYADELSEFMDVNALGGFITKSVTAKPREGNAVPRIVETDSGMLNAIGLANIGLERFIKEKLAVLRGMKPAVFVNVAGETIEDYVAVVERLASEEGIAGFELNISCPNVKRGGITFGTDAGEVREITTAVKETLDSRFRGNDKVGNASETGGSRNINRAEKLLMVKLTPNVTDISIIARAAVEAGADALSLVNTFMAMVIDIETRKPVLANRTGGLSGPAIRPIAVYMVNKVYNEVAKEAGVPILGGGGIRTASDAMEFILAGASAVSVGTASFVEPGCAVEIIEGIKKYCERHGISNVSDLVGSVE